MTADFRILHVVTGARFFAWYCIGFFPGTISADVLRRDSSWKEPDMRIAEGTPSWYFPAHTVDDGFDKHDSR